MEEARREAAEIIDRLKRGEEAFPEPPAPEPTVADLAVRYMKAHVEVNCRAGTVETFGRVVRLYILPELGHMRLSEVERSHVAALHHNMRDKPYQANQARNVLAKMFRLPSAVRAAADAGRLRGGAGLLIRGTGGAPPPRSETACIGRAARAPVGAQRETLPERSHRTGRFLSCPARLPASPASRESGSAMRRRCWSLPRTWARRSAVVKRAILTPTNRNKTNS